MELSNNLISQFVKATKDTKAKNTESTVYGTAVVHGEEQRMYVKLDGSDLLTPVTNTTNMKDGERVTVMIKDHTATVTGNMTSPSARTGDVDDMGNAIRSEVDVIVADKVEVAVGEFDEIYAKKGEFDEIYVGKGEFDEFKAETGEFGELKADVAEIDTLIFGSASGTTIQTSFSNAVVAQMSEAQIKSAMIENVSADKISAGTIYTNNVNVQSEDGKLLIADETIQISDENRVRVQIGKDAAGDYSISIWDANGNLMFSEGGITDSAIKSGIIRNDMVSDDANISAGKLDISSLFKKINESEETIVSSRIYLDSEEGTLDVVLKEMSQKQGDHEEFIETHGSSLIATTEFIESKVWEQYTDTAIKDFEGIPAEVDTLKTKYSELIEDVDGINATVSETVTKAIADVEIGGRNTIRNSNFYNELDNWQIYLDGEDCTDEVSPTTLDGHQCLRLSIPTTKNFTYTVDQIDGASYGFGINENGYYESQNKGVSSSYAICRVNLVVDTACDVTFDVINYAESNYDYAVFGALDTALALSNSADSTAKENFQGRQSPDVVNVIYPNVSVGSHYIDVKFIKDTSVNNDNDSVQFKIQESEATTVPDSQLSLYQRINNFENSVQDYILSFDLYLGSNVKWGNDSYYIAHAYCETSPTTTTLLYDNFADEGTKTGEWIRVVKRFESIDAEYDSIILRFMVHSVIGDVYVRNFKLEKGTIVTDWSPAPEDMAQTSDVDSVNSDILAVSQSVSSLALTTNDITMSVKKIETDTTTAFGTVNDSIKTLSRSVSAMMTDEQVRFEIESAMSNGTSKVVTNTGFTFDDVGLTVEKSGSEMKTQITEDGMTVYQNDQAVLIANNTGVDAKNLHATTYLIVGGRSRFENYGTNRTGCFWIGG